MIIGFNELADVRRRHAREKIALAVGVFDLIHPGHAKYLTSLHDYAPVSVIVIKCDQRVHKFKGPNRPVNNELDRATVIDAIKGVDYTVIEPFVENEDRHGIHARIFATLDPDVYISHNPDRTELSHLTRPKIIVLPPVADYSTTAIIERIRNFS